MQSVPSNLTLSGNSSELLSASIPVNLYKVASVDVSGNYTATGTFAKLDLSSVSADNLDTAAATWSERAAEAKKLLKDDTEPTTTVTLTQGKRYCNRTEYRTLPCRYTGSSYHELYLYLYPLPGITSDQQLLQQW